MGPWPCRELLLLDLGVCALSKLSIMTVDDQQAIISCTYNKVAVATLGLGGWRGTLGDCNEERPTGTQ